MRRITSSCWFINACIVLGSTAAALILIHYSHSWYDRVFYFREENAMTGVAGLSFALFLIARLLYFLVRIIREYNRIKKYKY